MFTLRGPCLAHVHFDIPPDLTPWQIANVPYQRTGTGWTSNRPRQFTWQKSMLSRTQCAAALDNGHGVYILGLDLPHKAIYVGIAGGESFGSRLRKHRIKLTGSNAGAFDPAARIATSAGGVHHPENWRQFALARHAHFHSNALPDSLADLRLMIGTFDDPEMTTSAALQSIESFILTNPTLRDKIAGIFWPGASASKVKWLNGSVASMPEPDHDINFDRSADCCEQAGSLQDQGIGSRATPTSNDQERNQGLEAENAELKQVIARILMENPGVRPLIPESLTFQIDQILGNMRSRQQPDEYA